MMKTHSDGLTRSYNFLTQVINGYILKINEVRGITFDVNNQYDLEYVQFKIDTFLNMKSQIEHSIQDIDNKIAIIQRMADTPNNEYREEIMRIMNPIFENDDNNNTYQEAKSQILTIDDVVNYLREVAMRGREFLQAHNNASPIPSPAAQPEMEQHKDWQQAMQASFLGLAEAINKGNTQARITSIKTFPKFNGDVGSFASYWERFRRTVDENEEFDTLEKVNRLYEGLSGEALRVTEGIEATVANYETLKSILEEEYGTYTMNKVDMVNSLRELKKASNKASDCLQTLREVKIILRRLENAGSVITPEFCFLEVTNKFPYHIVKKILTDKSQNWKVDEILSKITEKVKDLQLQEKTEKAFSGTVTYKKYTTDKDGKPDGISTKTNETKRIWPCLFCKDTEHRSHQCVKVGSIDTKREILKKENRCWICFSPLHKSKECRRDKCPICQGDHNSVVCKRETREEVKKEKVSSNVHLERNEEALSNLEEKGLIEEENVVILSQIEEDKGGHKEQEQVLLRTAETKVLCNRTKTFKPVKVLIDEGSMRSFIKADIAKALALPHYDTRIRTYYGIGGLKSANESSAVKLVFHTKDGSLIFTEMITKPILTEPFLAPRLNQIDREFIKTNKLEMANTAINGELIEPDIILGMDRYKLFMKLNDEVELPSTLTMKGSVFGYVIHGCIKASSHVPTSVAYTTIEEGLGRELEDRDMIKNIFDIDSLGINTEDYKREQTNSYYQMYTKQLRIENFRITAPLPLKTNVEELKSNYQPSLYRLKALGGKIQQNREQMKWYQSTFEEYLRNDVIEEVPMDASQSERVFYLPHHGVWTEGKPKPLRVVFDGSAKQRDSPSLNETIHTGLSYVNRIHDIMILTRIKPIIITCDIESAFLQIVLQEQHRDLCRFLWLKDPNEPITRKNVREFRFKRLPFGLTASPSVLNMCLTWFLSNSELPIAKEILQCLYVDNIILFANTTAEATRKCRMVKALFKEISMNVRQFLCNDGYVTKQIPERDLYPMKKISILGIPYKPAVDTIGVNLEVGELPSHTKRGLLQHLHSIYDPMGLVNPLTLSLKVIFREVCDQKYGWDEILPTTITNEWKMIMTDIKRKKSINLKRAFNYNMSDTQLWVFTDASATALACCAYFKYPEGTSYLISGKSRLAPRNKSITIPQLELLAVRLGARLAVSIQAVIPEVQCINIGSDSMIAISWISNGKTLPRYVTHQVKEIHKMFNTMKGKGGSVSIYHVDTKRNPADIGSRGGNMTQLLESNWLLGPYWLNFFPKQRVCPFIKKVEIINSPVELQLVQIEKEGTTPIQYNLTYRSSRYANLRILANLGKMIKLWVKRALPNKVLESNISELSDEGGISTRDIEVMEKLLIKQAQTDLTLKDLEERHRGITFFNDDDGIIRVKSRLQNAPIPYGTKNPIYIPSNSPYAEHLIMHVHRETHHQGKDFVAIRLRQEYFLHKASQLIKRVIKECLICRRYHSLPFGTPQMPSLPKDRVTITKPFMNTGCDLLGPLQMKNKEKTYVCLFTCMTTRAIHLELVPDQSSKAFMNAFNRFISRRGVPEMMRSDGAGNFTLSSKMIEIFENCNEQELTTEGLMSYFAKKRIKWLFNTPLAPWKGGCWERLVGLTKLSLKKAIGKKLLLLDDFHTLLIKIEAILNTRPLTHPDPNELNRLPIRPSDFINPMMAFSLPEGNVDTRIYPDGTSIPIIQTMEQAIEAIQLENDITAQFWKIFLSEYLVYIRDIYKNSRKQGATAAQPPQVGEVVIIQEETLPRGNWKLGRILELIKGADDQIRSARIKTGAGNIILRSLSQIYSMEIRSIAPMNPKVTKLNGGKYRTHPTDKETASDEDDIAVQLAKSPKLKRNPKKIQGRTEYKEPMYIPEKETVEVNESDTGLLPIAEIIGTVEDKDQDEIPSKERELPDDHESSKRWWMPERIRKNTQKLKASRDCPRWLKKPNKIPPINKHLLMICCIMAIGVRVTEAKYCGKAKMFSRDILVNPHCDEWIAWATILIPIIIGIAFITCACRIVRGQRMNNTWSTRSLQTVRSINQQRKKRPQTIHEIEEGGISKQDEPEENPRDEVENQTRRIPQYMRIGSRLSLLMIITISIAEAQGCQKAHIRHSTEIVCANRTRCYKEYTRDFILSAGMRGACMEFSYQEQPVGSVEVRLTKTRYRCLPTLGFFTRDTKSKVTTRNRCSSMGSCDDSCETMSAQQMIEDMEPYQYPFQIGCKRSCGFLLCGCVTWSDSCTFYKLEHIPANEEVYKVVSCNSWITEVELTITTNLFHRKEDLQIIMRPYETYQHSLFNLTMVSHVRPPVYGLQREFAISGNETFMVNKEEIMVRCATEEQAEKRLNECTTTKHCDCEVDQDDEASCHCPFHRFTTSSRRLPHNPYEGTIIEEKGEIIIEPKFEESKFTLESATILDGNSFIYDFPCHVTFINITGCYECEEGASAFVKCLAQETMWISLQCHHETYMTECGTNEPYTRINYHAVDAYVSDVCTTKCAGEEKAITMEGTLYYNIEEKAVDFKKSKNQRKRTIDLNPLVTILTRRWKLLGIGITILTVVSLGCYITSAHLVDYVFVLTGRLLQIIAIAIIKGYHLILRLLKEPDGPQMAQQESQ